MICIHLRVLAFKTISMFLSFSSITTGANKEAKTTCVYLRITWVSWDSCFAITVLCCALRTVCSSWPLYHMSWYRQSFLAIHLALTKRSIYWCSVWIYRSYLLVFKYCFILESVYASFLLKSVGYKKF